MTEHISHIKKVLETFQKNKFVEVQDGFAKDIAEQKKELLKRKSESKSSMMNHDQMRRFLEYLGKDPQTWPSVKEADEALKEVTKSSEQVKEQIEDEKEKIQNLSETAKEGYDLLQSNLKKLSVKVKLYEEKLQKLQALKAKQEMLLAEFGTSRVEELDFKKLRIEQEKKLEQSNAAIKTCQAVIDTGVVTSLKSQMEGLTQKLNEKNLELQEKQRQGEHHASHLSQSINRYKSCLLFCESLDSIREHAVGTDKIQLEFLNGTADDLNLVLTLTFKKNNIGYPVLTDVKSSVENFEIHDLINMAIEANDIRFLVHNVRDRWKLHYPLLSEINKLVKSHAVDWIQEEGRLRVLVGRSGSIIFTMKVPTGYPFTGNITLISVFGLDIQNEDLRELTDIKTLTGWVVYLEQKFGGI
ncbi:hypothetical protein CHS0354_034119 [Potamilus streckersoni]|uniref:Uncharacterized protein n=1 Tax=Potamilus streckersoni TaxID=2493646 RepID=A0AAE0WCC2_9BIVA|nr:hypothetical protein CHS0354_034119 [Potamilus streckersoni]